MQIGHNLYTAIGLLSTCIAMLLGLLATLPAVTASEKGRSFFKWYIFGFVLLPVALVAAYRIPPVKRPIAQ